MAKQVAYAARARGSSGQRVSGLAKAANPERQQRQLVLEPDTETACWGTVCGTGSWIE
jgi:hypothetical protein